MQELEGDAIVTSSTNRKAVIHEPKTQFQQQQILPLHPQRQQQAQHLQKRTRHAGTPTGIRVCL